MSFNKVRETYLIGGVAIVLVAMLSLFFVVQPRMAKAGEIGDQRAAAEAVNVKSASQIVALTQLKNGLPGERLIAAALAVKFPATADEPSLLRAIVVAAGKAGIAETGIKSLGPAAPIMGVASSGAKLPSAGAAPATGAAPAKDAQDLATMAITLNAEGSYTQMIALLRNLEDLSRSFLITQVNLSSAEAGKFTIALQGNMYVHRTVADPGTLKP